MDSDREHQQPAATQPPVNQPAPQVAQPSQHQSQPLHDDVPAASSQVQQSLLAPTPQNAGAPQSSNQGSPAQDSPAGGSPATPALDLRNSPARQPDQALSPSAHSPQNHGSTLHGPRSSLEKFDEDSLAGPGHSPPRHSRVANSDRLPRSVRRARTTDTHMSRRPGIDWIVPAEEHKELPPRPKSVAERLEPTIIHATSEKDKYAMKAKVTGWALNIAIGLQVLLGALTTGLSAAVKNPSLSTAVLGGLATLVASYMARARGSNEPELSITRVKDLEQFIRECEALKLDHGHEVAGEDMHSRINALRNRFEDLLGNASGERKLSPPV